LTFAYSIATEFICAHVCAVCSLSVVHSALGNEDEGVLQLYEGTCCLAWGVILDRKSDKGVVGVFSISNAGGSVCGCRCVYTQTHKHNAHMGYSGLRPGVRMRHLEGPKNLDRLNLVIYVFVYVYKLHICMYRLGGGMTSWTNCFFSLTYSFFDKEKPKMRTQITNNLKSKI